MPGRLMPVDLRRCSAHSAVDRIGGAGVSKRREPDDQEMDCRGLRHVLAGVRRLRQRRACGGFPRARHRVRRRRPGLRADGADDGLRRRAHLGRALQPGGDGRPCGQRALQVGRCGRLRAGAMRRRAAWGDGALPRRIWRAGFRRRRLRLERLRPAVSGGLWPDVCLCGRGRNHRGLPRDHPRSDVARGAERLRSDRHRPRPELSSTSSRSR